MSFQLDPNDNQPQGYAPQQQGNAPQQERGALVALRRLFSVKLILGILFFIAGIVLFVVFPDWQMSNNFTDFEANLPSLGRIALIIVGVVLVASHVRGRNQPF